MTVLRATYQHPDAARYLAPGGAWDGPPLEVVLAPLDAVERVVVVDGEVRLTGTQFGDAIVALARQLEARGICEGDVVAWQLPNCAAAVLLCRACWRVGAVAAPLHHQAGPADVARMLAALNPAVIFSDAEEVMAAALCDGDPPDGPAQAVVDPAAVAAVLFTSGSTGAAKAVLHTRRGLAYKARTMVGTHCMGSADAVLMPSPIAHISGLLNGVLVPAAAGMRTVLMAKWDAARGLALIQRERVSFMVGPPTLFDSVMDLPEFRPERVASMRVISTGAMGVRREFIDRARAGFGANVKRSYGSTEAPTVTTCTADDSPEAARDTDGRAVGDAEIRIVDPTTGEALPPGGRGEIQVRGPELFAGYADPVQTAEALHDGWFKTGDLGVLDGAGWLRIIGRLKDLIIRGGENIAAAEVEAVLEAHPAVRQAVAVGYPDDRLGERVAAFVIADDNIDVASCRRWFAEQGIARYKTPERVERLEVIPQLGVGKPDRAALRARAAHAVREAGA